MKRRKPLRRRPFARKRARELTRRRTRRACPKGAERGAAPRRPRRRVPGFIERMFAGGDY